MTAIEQRRGTATAAVLAILITLVAALGLSAGTAHATVSPRGGTFQCASTKHAWTEIAARPNSYVIGNCANGTGFSRAAYSDEANTTSGWEIGEIGGSFNGCGVVKGNESTAVDVNAGIHPYCGGDPSQTQASFISTSDCNAGHPGNCAWDPNLHGDLDTRLTGACTAYANARPFSPGGSTGIDPVGTLDANTEASYHFRMRYVTADRKMVLGFLGQPLTSADPASDTSAAPASMPQWVFLDATCVTLPHEESA